MVGVQMLSKEFDLPAAKVYGVLWAKPSRFITAEDSAK
jgi:hypothetical protein